MTCHLRRQFSSARSTKQFWQCQLCRCKLISSSTHPATNRVLSSSPQSIAQPAFCPRKFVARRDLGLSRLYRPALRFIPWFSSLDGREISGYSRVREQPGILFVYIPSESELYPARYRVYERAQVHDDIDKYIGFAIFRDDYEVTLPFILLGRRAWSASDLRLPLSSTIWSSLSNVQFSSRLVISGVARSASRWLVA